MDGYISPLIGLLGVMLGTLGTFLFSRFQKIDDRKQELLLDAYGRFIDATASQAIVTRYDEKDAAIALQELISAKQRLLYFAPTSVVEKLAQFDRTSMILGQEDADKAFADLLKAMRATLNLPIISDRDLFRVLIGKDKIGD